MNCSVALCDFVVEIKDGIMGFLQFYIIFIIFLRHLIEQLDLETVYDLPFMVVPDVRLNKRIKCMTTNRSLICLKLMFY